MTRASLGTAVLFLTGTAAMAQDKASQEFLTKAIQGNLAEVSMGELAQKNGQSGEVKTYGEMLQTDHTEANKKAIDASKTLGVTAPTTPSVEQKADHDELAKLTGSSFDKKFAEHMVMDHKKDIAEYQAAAKKAGCRRQVCDRSNADVAEASAASRDNAEKQRHDRLAVSQ